MTWMLLCNILMRYYPGLNHINIPELTLWQFVQSLQNIGWMESQANNQQSSALSSKVKDIRALAKHINPNLVIPED